MPEYSRVDPRVVIVVDDRERESGLLARLQERWSRTFEGRLPVGDIAVGPRVLIERKTIPDLALSIADGRLFRQAYQMACRVERPLFILEGIVDATTFAETSLSPHLYRSAILSLMIGYGIPVLRTRSVDETAAWLAWLAGQETRRGARPYRRRYVSVQANPEAAMLSALPGIGSHRARLLLDAFGSMRDILNANEEQLRNVKGIGKTTASMLAALGRPRASSPGRTAPSADAGVISEDLPAFGVTRWGNSEVPRPRRFHCCPRAS